MLSTCFEMFKYFCKNELFFVIPQNGGGGGDGLFVLTVNVKIHLVKFTWLRRIFI